jgi:hypothetical protein
MPEGASPKIQLPNGLEPGGCRAGVDQLGALDALGESRKIFDVGRCGELSGIHDARLLTLGSAIRVGPCVLPVGSKRQEARSDPHGTNVRLVWDAAPAGQRLLPTMTRGGVRQLADLPWVMG